MDTRHEVGAGTLVATLHVETGNRSAPAVEVREIVSPLGNWREYRVIALSPTNPDERHLVAALPNREQAITCAEALVGYLVDLAPPHRT